MLLLGRGCVKTSTRGGRAELLSLFSSFDGACQSGSFLIPCNRDKCSTRKFDVGVFTQPGSPGRRCEIALCIAYAALMGPGSAEQRQRAAPRPGHENVGRNSQRVARM